MRSEVILFHSYIHGLRQAVQSTAWAPTNRQTHLQFPVFLVINANTLKQIRKVIFRKQTTTSRAKAFSDEIYTDVWQGPTCPCLELGRPQVLYILPLTEVLT